MIAGERLEDVEDAAERLTGVVLRIEVVDHRRLGVFERRRSGRLLARVERQVPADREQPCRQMSVHPRRIFSTQPEEGLLDDVPGQVRVAEQPLRIAD